MAVGDFTWGSAGPMDRLQFRLPESCNGFAGQSEDLMGKLICCPFPSAAHSLLPPFSAAHPGFSQSAGVGTGGWVGRLGLSLSTVSSSRSKAEEESLSLTGTTHQPLWRYFLLLCSLFNPKTLNFPLVKGLLPQSQLFRQSVGASQIPFQ